MLIQALCEYADKQLEKTTPDGWQEQNISFRITLTSEGDIKDITDVRHKITETDKKGKEKIKYIPDVIVLPERTSTSLAPNIIEHRALYIFGLNYENDKFNPNDRTDKARKSQEAHMKRNVAFFKDIHTPVCEAYVKFLQKWEPKNETENPVLLSFIKEFSKEFSTGAYYGFCLETGELLEEDAEFKAAYDSYLIKEKAKNANEKAICGVYGKMLTPARIHDKIKFPGCNASGGLLVSFNEEAFNSYGKKQSYNANISEDAMKKYTFALNYLLGDRQHYKTFDDLVMVYFAMKSDDKEECDAFSSLLDDFGQKAPEEKGADTVVQTDTDLNVLMGTAVNGGLTELTDNGVSDDVDFYIIGMTPNSSRISVKFFWHGKFGTIIDNLKKFQQDLQIGYKPRNIFFSQIRKELISPKSSADKVPPALMSALTLSALQGTPFPASLLSTVIKRIKIDADSDTNHFIKLNLIRAGIIKACLNRNNINSGKEKIGMTWDDNNLNPAYVCGGLFSIYEELQKKSATSKLNRTIKDAYFSSACSCPNVIMPKLEKLSQHHLRKLRDDPIGGYLAKLQRLLITKLNGKFPATLTLDEQGQFIVGYYQMNSYLYLSKEEKEKLRETNPNTEIA